MNLPPATALPQTPLLVVDRAALDRNLAKMQALCDAAGVRLRAHGKMHKCSTLGRMQVARGAVGLCCQTVGEAEAYVAAEIRDVLVTAPSPPWAGARSPPWLAPPPSARSPTTRGRSTGCRTRPSRPASRSTSSSTSTWASTAPAPIRKTP
jgi:D-serine deaminase-like pyridoxal phosphate-dependent protein